MKQNNIFLLSALLVLAVAVIISGCAQQSDIKLDSDSQFEIKYSFGVNEKNILDSKNNLYTKDMVCNSSVDYEFILNGAERTRIFNAIIENDLYNIKNEFLENCKGDTCQEVNPLSTATLAITYEGRTKTIKWSDNYFYQDDPELKRFLNAENVILDIISQKEKELNVKQPECAYI